MVSLADIGAEAGYSRGIVTHQFGTKEQLLAAVAKETQRSFATPDVDGGLNQVVSSVEHYLTFLHERAPNGQAFLQLWAESIADEPGLRPIFVERDTAFREILADDVRTGITDGTIRKDADPHAVAVSVLGLLRGVALQLMATPMVDRRETITAEAVQIVRRGLADDGAPAVSQP